MEWSLFLLGITGILGIGARGVVSIRWPVHGLRLRRLCAAAALGASPKNSLPSRARTVFAIIDYDKCPAVDGLATYVVVISSLNVIGNVAMLFAGSNRVENMSNQDIRAWPAVSVKFGNNLIQLLVCIWGAILIFPNMQYFSSNGPTSNVTTAEGIPEDECQGALFMMGFINTIIPLAINGPILPCAVLATMAAIAKEKSGESTPLRQ